MWEFHSFFQGFPMPPEIVKNPEQASRIVAPEETARFHKPQKRRV